MGRILVERIGSLYDLAADGGFLTGHAPASHFLLLQIPGDVPVAVVAVLVVHGIGGEGLAVLVGHARGQHVLLEASVLYQLGVEAAVAGVADLLEEDAIEIG